MSNAARPFDTLQYFNRLQKVGVSKEQADVQAEAIKLLVDDKIAMKSDLKHLEAGLNDRINNLERRMDSRFNEVRLEITHLQEWMNDRMNSKINEVNSRINEMGYKIIISLGSMMVAGIVVLGVVIK